MSKYITIPESEYNKLVDDAKSADDKTITIRLKDETYYRRHFGNLLTHFYDTVNCSTGEYSIKYHISRKDVKNDKALHELMQHINTAFNDNNTTVEKCKRLVDEFKEAEEAAGILKQRASDIDMETCRQVYKIPGWIRWMFGIKYKDATE